MNRYNPKDIEQKWQKKWEEDGVYSPDLSDTKRPYYGLGMFNYPSGAGIHVGHARNYTIPDVVTRAKRQQGFNTYQPVGWDSFGLPAENYAIKTGVSPQVSIKKAVEKYQKQYRAMGWGVDWQKEIDTTDPGYYRWTQWIFSKLYENNLAYQKESPQWWCNQCKTVLADEQVIAGKCWRHESADDPEITKKSLNQWFFKITDYADELLDATDDLQWTQSVKASQKSWIGRSVGAEIRFPVAESDHDVTVFTTRPDTLFGVTFMVLAPENPLVNSIVTDAQKKAVVSYQKATLIKTDIQRQQEADKKKTGVFTGAYAINPINNEKIPIWIADYVLMGYGTGAIMAVPGHDERDFQFARKFELPVVEVVAPDYGIPLDGSVDVTGPVVIGFDPETKEYMSLINSKNGMRWLVSGGLDEGEDYETAALRELKEEAGFNEVAELIKLGGPTYSYYFNTNKNSNRRSFSYMYLAILNKNEKNIQSLEPHENYTVSWSSLDAIVADFEEEADGRGHWIDGMQRAKKAAENYLKSKEYNGPMYTADGILFDSGCYTGMASATAREAIVAKLDSEKFAQEKVNYKMRDWLISRQRYWGAPIPIIHCPDCGPVLVPEKDLPVVLPEIEDYKPTGGNASVLATVDEWVNVTCPTCHKSAKRETDTMDGYVCSSWYFFRYLSPYDATQAWDPERANKWMPVDFYNGADHATAHLLYARFFTRFFHKIGLTEFNEPFKNMVFSGKVKASDGSAFSKTLGNGVDPLEVIESGYGADALRLYSMFAAPLEQDVLWDPQGVPGAYRFLNRAWNLTQEYLEATESSISDEASQKILATTHKMIKKVTGDIEGYKFNTAIAAMMEAVNAYFKLKEKYGMFQGEQWKFAIESLLQTIAPFAPHMPEELWHELGYASTIHIDNWPIWDEKYLVTDTVIIVVQVNGKVRAKIEAAVGEDEASVVALAKNEPKIVEFLSGKTIKKTIYIHDKLLNLVVA